LLEEGYEIAIRRNARRGDGACCLVQNVANRKFELLKSRFGAYYREAGAVGCLIAGCNVLRRSSGRSAGDRGTSEGPV
jgi:hypothetical protein